MNLSALDITILGPGFLAGLIVLATHVPMGREVLKRGIIFIDLAVAQAAGLGAIAAAVMGWDPHGIGAQAAAVMAALAAGVFLTWTESRYVEVQEAIIGAVFVLAATAGILVLANHPKGGEELKDLLIGQILWVDMARLWPAAAVTAGVLFIRFLAGDRLGRAGFYVLFALSVTVSVQLVGVYLVFASLILPSLAVRRAGPTTGLWAGYCIGALGYAAGLITSGVWDVPTGPIVVWALAAVSLVAATLRGRMNVTNKAV
jgi:zinc/manganese transport system permease protein